MRTSRPVLLRRVVLAALLLVLFAQAVLSMRLLSATFDETTHLPSGYSYLKTGEIRLNPQHPPLVKLLSAIPLLALGPSLDLSHPSWSNEPPNEWAFGYRFLYANDADRLLFWGRMPVVLLTLLTAFYVHRWARELSGEAAGWTALSLCVFSPNLIAHGRFVTFDLPLACFSVMATYHLWRYRRDGSSRQLILSGLGLGLALASKFSGVILIGAFAFLLLMTALRLRRDASTAKQGRADRLSRAVGALAVLLFIAFLVVQASYFFSTDPLVYLKGLSRVNRDHDPNYAYYLMGQFKLGGWWYYFLAAFLFKTPIPTLLLLLAGIVTYRRLAPSDRFDDLFLAVPALLFLAVTSAMAGNLGVRYILPVYPFLFVFAGRSIRLLAGLRWTRAVCGVLAVWYVAGTLWIFPDHLAYFNELVGGPARGHLFLDDSNIDWGHDVKRIKHYLDRHGIDSIRMRYSRNANPGYYGIHTQPFGNADWIADPPPPGVYALGTHLLIRGEFIAAEEGLKTDWLSRYEPIGRVGYSCYLFRFE